MNAAQKQTERSLPPAREADEDTDKKEQRLPTPTTVQAGKIASQMQSEKSPPAAAPAGQRQAEKSLPTVVEQGQKQAEKSLPTVVEPRQQQVGKSPTAAGDNTSQKQTEKSLPTAGEAREEAPKTSPKAHDFKSSDVVGYDENGEPLIVRTTDPATGSGRTIVLNRDGSQAVFGSSTVASLLSTTQESVAKWIDGLSMEQMRGLTHEVGQRLVESSVRYTYHKKQYDQLSDTSNYAYFGLNTNASDKDLDLAYRKMAKQMHPDKNGGTEEAKKRFQDMKARYEALKERRTIDCTHMDGSTEERSNPPPEEEPKHRNEETDAGGKGDEEPSAQQDKPEGSEEEPAPQRKEVYEEDDDDVSQKQQRKSSLKEKKSIEYDPADRNSLSSTAKDMVEQLRTLESHMKILVTALRRQGR